MKEKLLVSFSGGRTSAFMTYWLFKNMKDKYEMKVVFANTGKERNETLDFVEKCDKEFSFGVVWVEANINEKKGKGTTHIVTNYLNAKRNGEPFENVIKKYGMPNQNAPFCTRELKLRPIQSYAKSIGWKDYQTALGIRNDEPRRLNWEKKHQNNLLYFAELVNVTKSDVNFFWSKQSFDLDLKSFEGNCDLCYKKSMRKLLTIIKNKPELTTWWKEMEEKYQNYIPEHLKNKTKLKTPLRFYREQLSIDDLIEDTKMDFIEANDESHVVDKYKQMVLFNQYLDENFGCTESCEIW